MNGVAGSEIKSRSQGKVEEEEEEEEEEEGQRETKKEKKGRERGRRDFVEREHRRRESKISVIAERITGYYDQMTNNNDD